jgi:hypothetical protein
VHREARPSRLLPVHKPIIGFRIHALTWAPVVDITIARDVASPFLIGVSVVPYLRERACIRVNIRVGASE